MANTVTSLEILTQLETQCLTILVASGYNNSIKLVDREYRERAYEQYPYIMINDIEDKYVIRMCKNLYKKILIVEIVGFIYDDTHGTGKPQLGTKLQQFKEDLSLCLSRDTWFNNTTKKLQILDITTNGEYVVPNAAFICRVGVSHYDTK